ncbi:phosphoglycerate mutase family protein [Paracoccidioides lutzii Pb01]|uniref:Phosphoglycerate mutase family protein n=1 Tax=Paracoccidioides lutzii (strain ATCC MYA-826 / Pb01) TaxID=502779 RepID=C1H3J3_PARBA|nr:phosphoglycerate mutase family protein [Paracoccidioides lutzii Pb01]EEH34287.1 phosphoglycerate mutase family protein [Paracoccidioides lutzii Pb01]
MPLDRIYVTRHGVMFYSPSHPRIPLPNRQPFHPELTRRYLLQHRLNWTINLDNGTYHSVYPTPTGIPVDPTLTGPGVRQSQELAAHLNSDEFSPKPCRVYSSPFYRCLQTIQPTVEALKARQERERKACVDLDVRMENGLGEWFGSSSFFTHPAPAPPETLRILFPTLLNSQYEPHVYPSPNGETIAILHDRIATTLQTIIAQVDAELDEFERDNPAEQKKSRAILICTHAAPLIAIGRALTGDMPEDTCVEDFRPFTASLSTFVRKRREAGGGGGEASGEELFSGKGAPQWQGGIGVGGGWICVGNGDCGFLSGGEERGWHFNGEEDFDTMPAAVLTDSEGSPAKL